MNFCWRLGPFGFTLSGYCFFLAPAVHHKAVLRPKNSAYVSLRESSHVSAGCGIEPAVWSEVLLTLVPVLAGSPLWEVIR